MARDDKVIRPCRAVFAIVPFGMSRAAVVREPPGKPDHRDNETAPDDKVAQCERTRVDDIGAFGISRTGTVEIEMLLCCLLAVLLISICISVMPLTGTTVDRPDIVTLHGLLLPSRMFARKARVLRSGSGSAVLILI